MAEAEELTPGQARQMVAGIGLLCVVYEILTAKPPKREHWWQVWREKS